MEKHGDEPSPLLARVSGRRGLAGCRNFLRTRQVESAVGRGLGFRLLVFATPFCRARAKPAGEHEVEQAQGLVSAFQRDVDDFGFGGGQEFTGPGEPEFGAFLPEGHSNHFLKNPAQMPRGATRGPDQVLETQVKKLRSGRLLQKFPEAFPGVEGLFRFGIGEVQLEPSGEFAGRPLHRRSGVDRFCRRQCREAPVAARIRRPAMG